MIKFNKWTHHQDKVYGPLLTGTTSDGSASDGSASDGYVDKNDLNKINLKENEYRTRLKSFENTTVSTINNFCFNVRLNTHAQSTHAYTK